MNEDELKSGKQIWDSIESILEDLDKDQIDRLMALGSDDPELFIDEILKEGDIKKERMRQEETATRKQIEKLRSEFKEVEAEKQRLEAENQKLKAEVKRRKKEVEISEKRLHETIEKKMNI